MSRCCWILFAIFLVAVDLVHTLRKDQLTSKKVRNCVLKNGKLGLCRPVSLCSVYAKSKDFLACPSSQVCCFQKFHKTQARKGKKHFKTSLRTKRTPGKEKNFVLTTTAVPSTSSFIPNLRVKGCGVKKILSSFVVGGDEAGFWPWMVAIFVQPPGATSSRFLCGGTVISRRYILTAAHCLGQRNSTVSPGSLSVRVGGLTLNGDGETYRVSETKVHPDFRDNLHYDDIALLRTDRDFTSKEVLPACLPSPGMYNANFFKRNATVLGWGAVSFGGGNSNVLRQAVVPVVQTKRCDARYRRLGTYALPRGITDTQLCAGTSDGSRDACQGDSGGPLVLEDSGGKWNVVGIVSFGYRCAEPTYPGVYTRVAKYLPWLWRNTDISARNSPS